jgi:hypothetical protein
LRAISAHSDDNVVLERKRVVQAPTPCELVDTPLKPRDVAGRKIVGDGRGRIAARERDFRFEREAIARGR